MAISEILKIVNKCIEEGKIIQEAYNFSFFYNIKEVRIK